MLFLIIIIEVKVYMQSMVQKHLIVIASCSLVIAHSCICTTTSKKQLDLQLGITGFTFPGIIELLLRQEDLFH